MKLEVFQQMPLFKEIALEEIEKILQVCTDKSYQKGECIVREGECCSSFGIVATGEVVVLKENSQGESQILAKLSSGRTFGEMLVYSSVRKWPATVWAAENTMVYFMDLQRMIQAQTEFPQSYGMLIRNFIREISDKALGLNKKLEYLSLKKMRGRLAKYLLEQLKMQEKKENDYFQIPLNRNELADFLAVSRPSMSRELSKMREEHLIDFHKNRFRIVNLKQLRAEIE